MEWMKGLVSQRRVEKAVDDEIHITVGLDEKRNVLLVVEKSH